MRESVSTQFSVLYDGEDSLQLLLYDVESVQKMLDTTTAVLVSLSSSRTQHLLLMRGSPRYLDRLATSLLSPQLLANKAMAQVIIVYTT